MGLWERLERFDFEGEFFRFKKAILGAKPARGKVPIYIAAHRPKSLRVASEMGEGWITLPQPPFLFAKKRRQVEEWRKNAGGDLDKFDKCQYLFTSIAKDK